MGRAAPADVVTAEPARFAQRGEQEAGAANRGPGALAAEDATKLGDNSDNLSFEQAKKAEAVAESQQELLKQAEQARQALQELQKNAETAGIADSALMARLAEVQQQLEKALTPEIRAKLEELRQALKELDAERTQEALQDLAEKQKALREALERSRELFERAAMEGQLESLAQDSKELQKDQADWNKQWPPQTASVPPRRSSSSRRGGVAVLRIAAAFAADEGPSSRREDRPGCTAATRPHKRWGRPRSRRSPARSRRRSREGEEAEKELAPLGDELQEEREQMAQDWRDEVVQQLDQALADVSRLG